MRPRLVVNGREANPFHLLQQDIEGLEHLIDCMADDHPDLPRFLELHRKATADMLALRGSH